MWNPEYEENYSYDDEESVSGNYSDLNNCFYENDEESDNNDDSDYLP